MEKQKRKIVVPQSYPEQIPVHMEGLRFQTNEAGQVTIFQENRGPVYRFTQLVFHKPRVSQIHLDTMGNFVWPLLDGSRNVNEIVEAIREHFGDSAEPAFDRLVQYLQTLESYGFIQMMQPAVRPVPE